MKGKYLPFLILPLFLFSFLLVSPLGVYGTPGNSNNSGNANSGNANAGNGSSNVCPGFGNPDLYEGDWHGIEVPDDNATANLISYSASAGYTITAICVKGGQEGNSQGGYLHTFYSDVWFQNNEKDCILATGIGTASASVSRNSDLTGSICANISHASFRRKDTPPPVLEPDWTLSKTVGDQCVEIEGETYAQAIYTITIQNKGTGGGTITHIVDELDSKVLGTYIESISDDGEYDEGEIIWDFGDGLDLDSNSSKQFTYTILIPEEAYGTYGNTAMAYSYPEREVNGGPVALLVENGIVEYEKVAEDSVTVDLECEIEEEEIEEEEEEEVIQDNEGEVLGVSTKAEEEIEEVGVVLAATGSTNNILVYVIQSVLSLSTILSGIFFSKKYIM